MADNSDLAGLALEIQRTATEWAQQAAAYDRQDAPARMAYYRAQFSDIPELFAGFEHMPVPEQFMPLLDDMDAVLRQLSNGAVDSGSTGGVHYGANPTLAKYLDVDLNLAEWTGQAAEAFRSNFLTPFPAVAGNQYLAACSLNSALTAEQALWEYASNDIHTIAHNTLAALDSLNQSCQPTAWSVVFSVAALVIGVVDAPLGDGAAVVVAIIGATVSLPGAVGAVQSPTYSATDGPAVIDSMRDAITTLKGYIADKEHEIAAAMQTTYATMCSPDSAGQFTLAPPALGNATAADVTSPEYLGSAH